MFKSNDIVVKSPNDRQQLYRVVELESGLSALLIHDPEIYPNGPPLDSKTLNDDKEEEETDEDDYKDDDDEEDLGEDEEEDEDNNEEDDDLKGKGNASQAKKGLRLFKLDIKREHRIGDQYYVININYFPGYGKMPEYEHIFTDFLLSLVHNQYKKKS